jgi:hypothetical protein
MGKSDKNTNKKYKISFCTVCMNRLHHLKKTLPKNIEDNLDYGNVEFVVLNYGSRDELDVWIKTEMAHHLENGTLKYIKTTIPTTFHMSHSKNVVAKQATGDIICNVDADNYIGAHFAAYINREYNQDKNIYLAVNHKTARRDCCGRICVFKEDFLTLKGYDESMEGYGFEDNDFWNRMELLGRKIRYIDNVEFLQVITHEDQERLQSESNNTGIYKIYIQYIDHSLSKLLYLFRDKRFYKGKIVNNYLFNSRSISNLLAENQAYEHSYNLYDDTWLTGIWSGGQEYVELRAGNGATSELKVADAKNPLSKNTFKTDTFYPVTNKEDIEDLIMFFSQINNRIKMKRNKELRLVAPNISGFGETVFV